MNGGVQGNYAELLTLDCTNEIVQDHQASQVSLPNWVSWEQTIYNFWHIKRTLISLSFLKIMLNQNVL